MLYCLSGDLYDDLKALRNHKDCKYDSTNMSNLVGLVPQECKYVSRLSYIMTAAKHLYNTNAFNACIIARSWISEQYPSQRGSVDLDHKYQDGDSGYWEYVYTSLASKKIFVSKAMYSKKISVRDGVPYYCIDHGLTIEECTLAEIEKSDQYFKFEAVFPANPRMFAEDQVEYMIPYNLI